MSTYPLYSLWVAEILVSPHLSYGDQLLAESVARRGTPQLIADVSVNAAVGNHMNRYQTHEIAQMAANAAQNDNNLNRLFDGQQASVRISSIHIFTAERD